jgi:hypothetical protein
MPEWLKALLDLLARLFAPKPTPPGPTGPTAPTGPTLPTGPSGPAPAPQPVTKDTPFRDLPVISAERMCAILKGFPMEGECRLIHAALAGRPLALAQSWMESSYGKSENAERTRNALGLMQSDGRTLQVFPTFAAGFGEWARRMDDPDYKGGVYQPRNMTLERMIYTYVGGPGCWATRGETCANGETGASVRAYLAETVARLNRYYGIPDAGPTGPTGPRPMPEGLTAHALAGTDRPLWLPATMGFEVVLTPKGPNRSGRAMLWSGVTAHTTNNTRPGTDALSHSRWQDSGTPGHPDGKVAVHFYVDDKRAIQKIPVDEQGIHSGDWRNQAHVSVELCVNSDRNPAQAERNAQALQAGLLDVLGTTAEANLYPHTNDDLGHCPRLSIGWQSWVREVDRRLAAMRPGAAKG